MAERRAEEAIIQNFFPKYTSVVNINVIYTNIVNQVSWFKSSLLLRIQNKHTYKY
jgi:hypothetical protein